MTMFERGKKEDLSKLGCDGPFRMTVTIATNGMVIDVACFGLDHGGRLSDDRYMVFYRQMTAPDRAVVMAEANGTVAFDVDLARLPATIHRLVFTASVDGAGTMSQIRPSSIKVGTACYNFTGADFDREKAVKIGEIYRHGDGWRFGAVGQGFHGGLAALLRHFGGIEIPISQTAASAPVAAAAARVTLTKPGQEHAITLAKDAGAPAELVVKAAWRGNGDGRTDNDDLDLRAGLLLPDGRMKLITAPDHPGNFAAPPYVRHLGDVRNANCAAGGSETILVNPAIARHVGGRVALVFSVYSAIGNGVVSIASLKPRMRMEYGAQVVECEIDFSRSPLARNPNVYTYVIGLALIDEDTVVLQAGGQTSNPNSEHTPWLTWKGGNAEVSMDGPPVFKGTSATSFLASLSRRRYS